MIVGISLYLLLGWLFFIALLSKNNLIKITKFLHKPKTNIDVLYRLFIIIFINIMMILFSPLVFIIFIYQYIKQYIKRRKFINQIAKLEKVVK